MENPKINLQDDPLVNVVRWGISELNVMVLTCPKNRKTLELDGYQWSFFGTPYSIHAYSAQSEPLWIRP